MTERTTTLLISRYLVVAFPFERDEKTFEKDEGGAD